ncbi:hypothetical protein NKOR_07130 [Candidatus Nitrosopumilus koreensis AR1]|uniref:Uncharacterized protein n=1 Tax=Candidatus Nitrosopumilus koreensis AR1 TaxID=1229908 RepID=K0B543_9ARCH|nr:MULTISPECIES: hypothetical protein [Nitrosopumilus]AFS81293.1 hypothetical protein NKOR_07130 [Candidatus Nitrosopumilus koreensis AR1]
MVSQYVMIGIAVGVFFAGIGIGYAMMQTSTPQNNFMQMTPQQMQQMMNDPNMMNQWHQTMMNNPDAMNQWMSTMMNDPQAMTQMHNMMMNNQQHMNMMMQPMMNTMMNDPQYQQRMLDMMMDSHMMGSGMMGNMMGTSITEQSQVLDIINNIEKILDDVSINYRNGEKDTAFSLATNAYLENYEYVESAIAQKDRPLMEKIELMLRVDLRNMIKNGDASDMIDAKIDSIKMELTKAKSLF